jgi:hypothetical protein
MAVLTSDSTGAAQVSAMQLGARLSCMAAGYLKTTPLAQWHHQKLQLDEASVIERARARGLRMARSTAVNSDAYAVYDHNGRFLRRGSLSAMKHFAEHYQG